MLSSSIILVILLDYETELCLQQLLIPDAIRIWKSLPQQLIDCSNVELFRYIIHEKFIQFCHAKLILFY